MLPLDAGVDPRFNRRDEAIGNEHRDELAGGRGTRALARLAKQTRHLAGGDAKRELLLSNATLYLKREASDIFDTARAPSDVISDLVAEVVWQVLMRDRTVATEEQRRDYDAP